MTAWRRPFRVARLGACLVAIAIGSTGCASLPPQGESAPSYQLTDTADTHLGRQYRPKVLPRVGETGVHPLRTGAEALVARLLLADAAEQTLDVQYYIFHGDDTGSLVAHSLLLAADRGVRVRLLLDDMYVDKHERAFHALHDHPNLEIRLFNPFASRYRAAEMIGRFGRLNRRMHNKSFTADNQVTIIGGRNIGDEYFQARPDLDFGDLDVIAVGDVVKPVSTAFDEYWNSPYAYPIDALDRFSGGAVDDLDTLRAYLDNHVDEMRDSDYARLLESTELATTLKEGSLELFWGRGAVVYDDPEKVTGDLERDELMLARLRPLFDGTVDELLLVSPYFVPGKRGTEFLAQLVRRGIRVRVVTNSLAATDVAVVHSGYARYRRRLLQAGVALFEFKPGARINTPPARSRRFGSGGSSNASLHAKTFVFDRTAVFVGSLNLDPRSIEINTEIGVVLESPEFAESLLNRINEKLLEGAYEVRLREAGNSVPASARVYPLEWRTLDNGVEVVFTREPEAGFGRRLLAALGRIVPIEGQL